MSDISKEFTAKKVKCFINSIITKKSQFATIYITFPGERSILLSKVLYLFTKEMVLPGFLHPKSFVFSAQSSQDGIILECPDSKCFNTIMVFYNYMLKMKVPGAHIKYVEIGKDNYENLYKRLSNMRIQIIGKCKSTYNAISTNSKKFTSFQSALGELYDKYDDKIKHIDNVSSKYSQLYSKAYIIDTKSPNNNLLNLYLAIVLQSTSGIVKFNGTNLVIEYLGTGDLWSVTNKSMYQSIIKSFLTQFGVIGSEPSDSAKKAAYKTKVSTILECLNKASEMICGFYGFKPYKFNSASDADVNKEVLGSLKSIKEV